MRHLLPIALALALPACATTQTCVATATTPCAPAEPLTTRIKAAVDRAASAWAAFKPIAQMWLPFLPADRQAQVNAAIAIGDRAISTAQLAATAADATAALIEAQGAMTQVSAAVAAR